MKHCETGTAGVASAAKRADGERRISRGEPEGLIRVFSPLAANMRQEGYTGLSGIARRVNRRQLAFVLARRSAQAAGGEGRCRRPDNK